MNKQDLLQREDFVNLLEKLIDNKINKHEGFSFAIDGKWGCGKSFILKMLEEKLEGNGYLVIHYNCWASNDYDNPLVGILSTIVDKLNDIKESSNINDQQKREKLKIAGTFLKKTAMSLLKNKIGVDFKEIESIANETLEADKKPYFSPDFNDHLSIKQTTQKICDTLLGLKLEWRNGLVIIVDELDRCLPDYAIKVLESLHHICFNTDTDKYHFIQLLAINKAELSHSVAKSFGRDNFIFVGNQGTNGRISRDSVNFADYYLQKFLQLVLPVPVGNSNENSFSILEKFENHFLDDINGTEGYIEKFLEMIMAKFPIRTVEELVNHTKMVHDITIESNSELAKPHIGVLAVELIDCLYRIILKTQRPHLEYGHIEHYGVFFWIDGRCDFHEEVKEWSLTHVDGTIHEMDGGGVKFDTWKPMNNIKYFYCSEEDKVRPMSRVFEQDEKFVEAFRKTLDIIAPPSKFK